MGNATMKVSVIIPTYNRRQPIARTLLSGLAQTYQDYELIVIDDASTDGTSRWLQQQYPALHLIQLPTNRGAAAARNVGIQAATGDAIAFLDSDDRWDKTYLEPQVQALQAQPTAVLSATQMRQAIAGQPHTHLIQPAPLDPSDLVLSMLYSNWIPTMSQVIIPRTALEQVGLLEERLLVTHDRDLYLRLFVIGAPIQIHSPLVTKVSYPDSLVTMNQCQTWLVDGLRLLELFYTRPESAPYRSLRPRVEAAFRQRVAQCRVNFIQQGLCSSALSVR
jgi:glycosyltransferase involved in cell wall biosynthesis